MEKYEKLEIEVILLDNSSDIVTVSNPTETPSSTIFTTPNRSMFSSELDYYAYLEDNDLDDE